MFRSILLVFFTFLSSLGDTLFLAGLPLYFYNESGGDIIETTYVSIIITITIFLSRKIIIKTNKVNALKLIILGEILMCIIEFITLGVLHLTNEKYIVLASVPFLAFIYNVYAPAKFYKIQDYFFAEKKVFFTSFQSVFKHAGQLFGVAISGVLLTKFSIKHLILFDALTFLAYGLFVMVSYKFLVIREVVTSEDKEQVKNMKNNIKPNMLIITVLSVFVTFFLTWQRSSAIAFLSAYEKIGLDHASVKGALLSGMGLLIGLFISFRYERYIKFCWRWSVVSVVAFGVLFYFSSNFYVSSLFFINIGLIGSLTINVQKMFFKEVSFLYPNKNIIEKFWIFTSISSVLLTPIAFIVDNYSFVTLNSSQMYIITIFLVGTALGLIFYKYEIENIGTEND